MGMIMNSMKLSAIAFSEVTFISFRKNTNAISLVPMPDMEMRVPFAINEESETHCDTAMARGVSCQSISNQTSL